MILLISLTGIIITLAIGTHVEIQSGIVEEIPNSIVIGEDINEFLNATIVGSAIVVDSRPTYLGIQILVGDFVICWRAWVLLPHDKFWRSVLAVIMTCNIGMYAL